VTISPTSRDSRQPRAAASRSSWLLPLGWIVALLAIGSPAVAQSLTIDNVTSPEGDSGTGPFTFTVTLAPSSAQTVTVNYATQNNSAQAPADYTATSGTLTFLPGQTTQTLTVDVQGDTTWEGLENFFVNLSSPVSATIADSQGVGFIQNDDVTVSIGDATVPEGDAGTVALVFNVTLSAPKNNLTLTVDYTTQNNSAQAPADYTATSGTVTFLPGETAKTVTVYANGDTTWEGLENFFVNLSNVVNCSLGDAQGVGSIQNDDVTVSIGDVTMMEGNGGTTAFDFAVTLSAPKDNLTLMVSYATANNSAQAPSDYAATSGVVTFLPGVTSQTVTVQVAADLALESLENFYVNLSNAVNCSLGDAQGLGFIQNDDVQGSLSIDDLSYPEGSGGQTPFAFTVTLSPPSASTVTVQFATANGTAIAGQDYVSGSGTVTFAAGETTKLVTVNVIADTLEECDETFVVNLSNAFGAPISDAQATGTIEDDENATCPDLDGDCHRDEACGGSDCDDLNPDTYAGATEVNDGADNQCTGDPGFGVADEISGACGFPDPSDPTKLSWPAQPWAVEYEVARAGSRDFTVGCTLFASGIDTFVVDVEVPPSRGAFYYLVRALSPNVGSWGQRSVGTERTVSCSP